MRIIDLCKVFILAILLLITVSPTLSAQDLSANIFNQGMQLYSAGDFSGAADYLEQVVSMNPQHDQARYYLVFSFSQSGKMRKALEHARILAERFPQQKQFAALVQELNSHQFSLSTANQQQNIPDTKADYEKPATATKKTSPRSLPPRKQTELERAIVMIDEENIASAAAILEEIVSREPRNSKVLNLLGVTDFNQGEFKRAASYFEKAIIAGSKDFETFFLAGSCYLNLQLHDKAEAHFRKALEIHDDVFCQLNLAEIFLKSNRLKEAEQAFKNIQKKHPDIVDASVGLAQILFEQGHIETASHKINDLLAAHPENTRARIIKAKILIENKLYAEAAEEARLASLANPDNPEYKAVLAIAMIRNFQVPQGIEEARSALQKKPESIDAMLAIAEGMIVSGDTTAARAQLSAAEKVGMNPGVSFLLASIAVSEGNHEQAREHYENYRKRSGKSPKAQLEYARFLETSASASEAAAAYHEILASHTQTAFAEEAQAAIDRLAHATNRPEKRPTTRTPLPGLNNP